MKTIVIDAREAMEPKKTGKGQWTFAFITELIQKEIDVTLLVEHGQIALFPQVKTVCLPRGVRFHFSAAAYVRKHLPDAFLSPTSFIAPALLGKKHRNRLRIVVHDLIAFRSGKHSAKARLLEKVFLPLALRNSSTILTTSVATKDELLHFFPAIGRKKVIPIFAGPMSSASQLAESDQNFLLCAGTLCPRKNQLRLLQAYSMLEENLQTTHPLILVGGRGWHDQEIVDLANQIPTVTYKGYVTDTEYMELLHHTYALVYPSEYEGFGLQVLDALQLGVPVLTSQGGSLQELVSDAALIVDPLSIQSITNGLQELLTDAQLHNSLQKMGPIQAQTFTWATSTTILLNTL